MVRVFSHLLVSVPDDPPLTDVLACRKFLGRMLEQNGVTVSEAKDGAQAVEAVCRDLEAFQVVFMDNSMPVMVRYPSLLSSLV